MKNYYEETVLPELKMWRQGFGSMPKSYINYHISLAKETLMGLNEVGYKIHSTDTVSSGNLDGMMCFQAIVEDKNGKLTKVVWLDAGSGGDFMEILPHLAGMRVFNAKSVPVKASHYEGGLF